MSPTTHPERQRAADICETLGVETLLESKRLANSGHMGDVLRAELYTERWQALEEAKRRILGT